MVSVYLPLNVVRASSAGTRHGDGSNEVVSEIAIKGKSVSVGTDTFYGDTNQYHQPLRFNQII